jgi:hypothetical protein
MPADWERDVPPIVEHVTVLAVRSAPACRQPDDEATLCELRLRALIGVANAVLSRRSSPDAPLPPRRPPPAAFAIESARVIESRRAASAFAIESCRAAASARATESRRAASAAAIESARAIESLRATSPADSFCTGMRC